MRPVVYCPFCGKRFELDEEPVDPRETQRLKPEEIEALVGEARSNPPPPLLGEETLPDEGWLQKYLAARQRRLARSVGWLVVVVGVVVLFSALWRFGCGR